MLLLNFLQHLGKLLVLPFLMRVRFGRLHVVHFRVEVGDALQVLNALRDLAQRASLRASIVLGREEDLLLSAGTTVGGVFGLVFCELVTIQHLFKY